MLVIGMKQAHQKLADKHGVSVSQIEKELSIGEKEELEHTSDKLEAHKIAMDHVREDSHYYSKLKEAGLVDSVEKAVKDLDYWKKKLMAALSGEKMSKSMFLMKGRGYPAGTIREWKGKKFKKLTSGKWMRTYGGSGDRGEKQAIRNVMKKIQAASSMEDLSKIVSENMQRFKDDSGKTLPIVKEFLSAARGTESGKKVKPVKESPEYATGRKIHENRSLGINKINLKEAKDQLAVEMKTGSRQAMIEALEGGIKQLEEVISGKEAKESITEKKPTMKWIFDKAKKGVSTGVYSFDGKLNNNMVAKMRRESTDDSRSGIMAKGTLKEGGEDYKYSITSDGYGKYKVTFQVDFKSEEHFQEVKKDWSEKQPPKQKIVVKKETSGKKYSYGMNNRPPGLGSAPTGFDYSDESNSFEGKPIFRHGIVTYDRKLTEEELNKFEMTPTGGDHINNVADHIIGKMGNYAKEYMKEENKGHFDDIVYQELMSVPYSKKVPGFEIDNLKSKIKDKMKEPTVKKSRIVVRNGLSGKKQ